MPNFKRKRGDGKMAMPDRFLRGGMEEKPESYSCNESTGGSTNAGEPIGEAENEETPDSSHDQKQFFKRPPLITETAALYQQSYLVSNLQND